MRTYRLVVALILAVLGLVWIGQGTNMIGGSAMSGSNFWAITGVILVIAAVVTLVFELRRPAKG